MRLPKFLRRFFQQQCDHEVQVIYTVDPDALDWPQALSTFDDLLIAAGKLRNAALYQWPRDDGVTMRLHPDTLDRLRRDSIFQCPYPSELLLRDHIGGFPVRADCDMAQDRLRVQRAPHVVEVAA